jgi:hypothetical protein
MHAPHLFLAYFSPETLLPVTSFVATIVGIALMLGRGSFRFLIGCLRRSLRRPVRIEGTSQPHLPVREDSLAQSPQR